MRRESEMRTGRQKKKGRQEGIRSNTRTRTDLQSPRLEA